MRIDPQTKREGETVAAASSIKNGETRTRAKRGEKFEERAFTTCAILCVKTAKRTTEGEGRVQEAFGVGEERRGTR